jgi:hypothetical protein
MYQAGGADKGRAHIQQGHTARAASDSLSESHRSLTARRTAETASSARGSSLSARLVGGSSTWRAQLRGAQDSMQRSCRASRVFRVFFNLFFFHDTARRGAAQREGLPRGGWLDESTESNCGCWQHHDQDDMPRSCGSVSGWSRIGRLPQPPHAEKQSAQSVRQQTHSPHPTP